MDENTVAVGKDIDLETVILQNVDLVENIGAFKEGRAKKVIVYKYKRKTGYHKKNGHRQSFTQVKIEKING